MISVTPIPLSSKHKDGIPLDNGYYALTKDHPLYSSVYYEAHRSEYEEYFGKQGTRSIGLSILDHSEVKGHLRDPDPAKRMQALFCRIDCMAVSADLKNAPALMHDKVLVAMSKTFEAIEYLKDIDMRMGQLWKDHQVRSDEYKWLAAAQASLRTIAGEVKKYLLGLDKEIYEDDPVLQQAYHRAVEQHYDPFNPKFPVQRDFGSNAIAFAGIDVGSTAERDHLTARLNVLPLFFAVADYFGEEQGSSFATSAVEKLLKSFGGAIHNPIKLVEAFSMLPFKSIYNPEKDVEKKIDDGIEYQQHYVTHVHFEFEIAPRGKRSQLIKRMKKLLPSLIIMRDLLRSDFDSERMKSMLAKFADDTKNDAISESIQKEDLDGATEHFLIQHFTLPE